MKSKFSLRGSLRSVFKIRINRIKINNNLKYPHFMILPIDHLIMILKIKIMDHNVLEDLVATNVVKNVEVIARVFAHVKMKFVSFKLLVIIFQL